MGLTWPANAIHLEARSSFSVDSLVVNMPYFTSRMKFTRSSTFCGRGGSCWFFSLYGSKGWVPAPVLTVVDIFVEVCLFNLIRCDVVLEETENYAIIL